MPIPIIGGKGHLPKRKQGGRGYLFLENRHSPVPLTLQLADGSTLVIPAGQTVEMKTLTCAHCNCVWVLGPGLLPPNWCAKCDAYVCGLGGCNRDCTPIAACVDLALAHTGSGQDFLGRGKDGSVLFDTRLRDRTRIH